MQCTVSTQVVHSQNVEYGHWKILLNSLHFGYRSGGTTNIVKVAAKEAAGDEAIVENTTIYKCELYILFYIYISAV